MLWCPEDNKTVSQQLYPYITKGIKDCIQCKRLAFRNKDQVQLISAQRELNQKLSTAKRQYKALIEKDFCTNNTKKNPVGHYEIHYKYDFHQESIAHDRWQYYSKWFEQLLH